MSLITLDTELAGGGGGSYSVLCFAGVFSDVSLSCFAQLQTSNTFGVFYLTGGGGPHFAIGFEPKHLDLRCASNLAFQTHCISSSHLHGLQTLNKIGWFYDGRDAPFSQTS